MEKTGRVSIGSGSARLNDGTRLARCGAADPFGSGISFLEGKNIEDGERITVEGSNGQVNGVAVFCMTNARHALMAIAATKRAAKKRQTGTKAGPKKKSRKTRSSATKRSSKKSSTKKSSKKTSSKKRPGSRKNAARKVK